MKKALTLTLSVIMVAIIVLLFVSCDNAGEGETSTPPIAESIVVPVCVANGHTWDNGVETESPTCTEAGLRTFTCNECDETKTEDIPALGHSYSTEWTNDVEPICTAAGSKSHHCTFPDCTEKVDITEIPALGHTWDNGVETKAPTCTENGINTFTCSVCNETRTEDVPITEHTVVIDTKKAATPSKTGLTEGKHCSVCNKVIVKQEVIPKIVSKKLAYTVNSDGTSCIITGIGECTDTEIAIGKKIDGYDVTGIGQSAFTDCTTITAVYMPDSLKFIGNGAFEGCSALRSITIPETVTSIESNAFLGCTSLTGVYITDIVKWCHIYFGEMYANPLIFAEKLYLNDSLVTELTLPDSVTRIGISAFMYCNDLMSVTIPDTVTMIDFSTFYGCEKLTSVTIPVTVTYMEYFSFAYCPELTSITYQGTKAQWNAITKDPDWHYESGDYTIYCTDGNITK